MTDENDITLQANEWTVSAREKISTGDYENYEPHITVSGEIPAPVSELTPERREALRERLLALHGDLQAVLGRAGGNRIAEPEFEDWSFGEAGDG